MTASCRRSVVLFGDVPTVLITVLLAGGSDIGKESSASTKMATSRNSAEPSMVSQRWGKINYREAMLLISPLRSACLGHSLHGYSLRWL